MADGDERPRRKRRNPREEQRQVELLEVFVLTSGTQDSCLDEDISEEICMALENTGCSVRLVASTRGWFNSMRTALWVARRSSASRLVLVDTHPMALVVLRCLAAPRLAYLQRTSHLKRLPVPRCVHQILLRLADDVIVQSRASADLYQTMFCNCKAPKILYPCIDIGSMEVDETISIQKILPNLTKYTSIYLTYGSFKPETNFDMVIDAFEIFYQKVHRRHRGDKVRLVIAGNLDTNDAMQNNYYSYLKERLNGKKYAKDVFFVTKLSVRYKKTLLAYSACAIFGFTTTRYLLEALFVGRPVVAAKNVAAKELLPRRAGFRLAPTAKEFAKALIFLHGDTQMAEKMGHNAKVYYAQHFSFGKFASKIQNFVDGNSFQCQTCLEFYGLNKKQSASDVNSCSNCTHEE